MSSVRSPFKVLNTGEDPINTASPSGRIQGQLDGGIFSGATKQEINNACDVSTRIVSVGAALTLTVADHAERIIKLDGATGSVVTLPASTGGGAVFNVYLGVVPSGGSHKIQVANSTDIMRGIVFMSKDDAAGSAVAWAGGASDDTLTFNGTTSGGSLGVGEWIEITDQTNGIYVATGVVAGTGVEVTPFSSAV